MNTGIVCFVLMIDDYIEIFEAHWDLSVTPTVRSLLPIKRTTPYLALNNPHTAHIFPSFIIHEGVATVLFVLVVSSSIWNLEEERVRTAA